MDEARKIADAVLYEGYILWPYRKSARKNQQRWTFGGVYPRAYSEVRGGDDPWLMQTGCLVVGDGDSTIEARVRFLHVTSRRLRRREEWRNRGVEESGVGEGGERGFVEELRVGDELYLPWDEATEREAAVGRFSLSELEMPVRVSVDVPAGSAEESVRGPDGEVAGVIVRSWRSLCGAVEVGATEVRERVFRVTVKVTNTTPWEGGEREEALRQTFVSTHTVLEAEGGEFVSMTDPPEELQEAAEACENIKTWPVLVGKEGERRMVLSAPIILSDYPQVAPESPGDLFDGGEIDQLLILNILTLTDEEKEEMRATDPKAREILERCENLSPEELMRLHGAIRDFKMVRE